MGWEVCEEGKFVVATVSVKYALALTPTSLPPVLDTPTSEKQCQSKVTGHDSTGSTEPVPDGRHADMTPDDRRTPQFRSCWIK